MSQSKDSLDAYITKEVSSYSIFILQSLFFFIRIIMKITCNPYLRKLNPI